MLCAKGGIALNTDKELKHILAEDEEISGEEIRSETTDEFSEIPEEGVNFENSIEEDSEEESPEDTEPQEPQLQEDAELTLFSEVKSVDETAKNAIEGLIDLSLIHI